jgi:predicted nucleic acid-binding protein
VKLVIDTNILFSLLRSENSPLRTILFDESHTVYAPNYIFAEIFEHKEKLQKGSKLEGGAMYEYLTRILGKIHFYNENLISMESRQAAYDLCKGVDEDDIPFVALAIELQAQLWTGDRKLKAHLERKGFTEFF